jgi:multidrug transporter EmrE-like cation transporter
MLAVLFIVFLISLCEAAGQSIAYHAYQKSSHILLAFSFVFYIAVVYLLYRSYAYKGVGFVNILWSGMTTILMIAIGYFVFHERLTTVEWIGAGLILAGILLMTLHQKFDV